MVHSVGLLLLVPQAGFNGVVDDVFSEFEQLLLVEVVLRFGGGRELAEEAAHVVLVDRFEDPESVAVDVDDFACGGLQEGTGTFVHLLGMGH
jgi:hypothetical protein